MINARAHPGGPSNADSWQISKTRTAELPRQAWVLRARPPRAELTFGAGVGSTDAGIFEGTWVGAPGDLGPLRATTPFGSGVLLEGAALHIVPPGHMLEGVYVWRRDGELLATNTLAGLLATAGLELDPATHYPPLLHRSVEGVTRTTIPTSSEAIEACFHDNLRLDLDGRLTAVPKPREEPFTSFADYRRRLAGALESALANAAAYEPTVTISSGYDGAAIAVLARELGCRSAVTIAEGKQVRGQPDRSDSGQPIGRRLGLEVGVVERLAYLRRTDLPEAEFLATGFSGEEVVMSGMEEMLRGRMLVSGFFGDGMWWLNRPRRPILWRSDQSGSSLGEWRLRTGFVHVPLTCFAGERQTDMDRISRSAEMRPWVLGRRYDKPIPRRILEEAGVPRGTFGEVKRAAAGTIHVDGPAMLAPASRAALAEFAASQGVSVDFRRRSFKPWDRFLLKAARRAGAGGVAARVEQRKLRLGVMEPVFGSLVLRWALSVVRPRYEAVGRGRAGRSEPRSDATGPDAGT